jgi:hypothetical protein
MLSDVQQKIDEAEDRYDDLYLWQHLGDPSKSYEKFNAYYRMMRRRDARKKAET